jgi:hypothetical protein
VLERDSGSIYRLNTERLAIWRWYQLGRVLEEVTLNTCSLSEPCSLILKRMLVSHQSGATSINLVRCPGPPCHLGPYCWHDNVGKKHYKVKTHHLPAEHHCNKSNQLVNMSEVCVCSSNPPAFACLPNHVKILARLRRVSGSIVSMSCWRMMSADRPRTTLPSTASKVRIIRLVVFNDHGLGCGSLVSRDL